MMSYFSLAFKILVFDSLTLMYVGVDFFGLILLGVFQASSLCKWMFFINLEFSAMISLNILSVPLSSILLLGLTACIVDALIVSYRSLRLCTFFFLNKSTDITSNLLIIFAASSNLLMSPCSILFITCTVFSSLEFLFAFFSVISTFLLLFSILQYMIPMLSFNSSYLVSFSPLHMFLRGQCFWIMCKTFGAPPGQFLFTFYLVNGTYI